MKCFIRIGSELIDIFRSVLQLGITVVSLTVGIDMRKIYETGFFVLVLEIDMRGIHALVNGSDSNTPSCISLRQILSGMYAAPSGRSAGQVHGRTDVASQLH